VSDTTTKTKTPISVLKLGHLVYEVSDLEKSTEFWTDIMGFTVSDTNEQGMVFLRSANDHHSIALVPAPAKKARPPREAGLQFHHLAMEVGSLEQLFEARTFLQDRGVAVTYEGRRGPGGNIGVEFEDPDGYTFEIYYGMDQVGPDGRSRPAEQFRRARTLEAAVAEPLPENW
jgi:catechol 2,3-dioxygenase-like lactoylglutathione lyase family enzyme